VAAQVGVAVPFFGFAGAGAGLAGDGGEPGPGGQVAGGGEPCHVQAGLGDDRGGEFQADARDLGQPRRGGQHPGVRPGVRVRDAVGGDPGGGRDGPEGGFDLVIQGGDLAVQEGDEVEVGADQLAVMRLDLHPVQGPLHGRAAALDPVRGQGGQRGGAGFPVGEGFEDAAGGLGAGQRGQDRRQLDQGALEKLLQPLPLPGAVADQLQAGAGQVPQQPDLRRGHERGAQQAHLGEAGDPLGVEPVGLGAAGELPGVGRVDQLDLKAGGFQEVVPDPPVVAGGLHRDQLDPVGQQPGGQGEDAAGGRGDLLDP